MRRLTAIIERCRVLPGAGEFFRAAAIFAQNVFAIFPASPDNFGRRAAARSPATWPNRFLTTKFLFL